MPPLISVCIPAYNRADVLPPLLDSVTCQTEADFDIIVVEDCSPQQASVRAIVADYSERYPGLIKYFENESNLGYDANLRRIFELADGEYCFFMGNDDLMCPDALSHVTSLLRRHAEVGVVMRSYAVFVGSSNNITQEFRYFAQERFFPAGVDTIVTFFRRMVVLPGIVIHRRTALRCATDRYDGTLLYQLYLVGRILTQMNGVFSPEITALYRGGGTPDFGNSTAEQGRFVPGDRTPESSLHFMSGMLQIAKGLADEMSLPVYEPILRDLSNYSYPFIAVQRHRPVGIYATYCYRLARLGFGKYPLFYAYALALLFLGTKGVERIIKFLKNRRGFTPTLGGIYQGEKA